MIEPGAALGTYRIERLLGRGGMGTVFLAYDTVLHRQVALKLVGVDEGGASARSRLLREARSAGETEQALDWLERAAERRDPNVPYIGVAAIWGPLRDTPGFRQLLQRLKLPS